MIDGVHIWRAALDDGGWPPADALPRGERERAAGFLRNEAAKRWVTARWALRRVLSMYVGEPGASIELEIGEHGKPRLPGSAGPEFNLSHSANLALIAVADRPVGIDIEAIRPRRDVQALADRRLPPEDAAAVRDAPAAERLIVFHAAWTRHEARLKCLGAGLSGSAGSAPVAVETIEVPPDYAAAVAVMGAEVGPLRWGWACPDSR